MEHTAGHSAGHSVYLVYNLTTKRHAMQLNKLSKFYNRFLINSNHGYFNLGPLT